MSLKDVASHAGVSFQTASKVLNGRRSGVVSAATRERILAVASEMDYVPNALARGLVRQSSLTIGVLAGELSDHALARFVVAAERTAAEHHNATLVVSAQSSGGGAASVRTLQEHRVDGILVIAPCAESDRRLGELLRTGVPAVSIVRIHGGGVPVVGSDHRVTAKLAAQHLLDLGHQRIGVVSGPRSRQVVRSRQRGFATAMKESGHRLLDGRVVESDWTYAGGHVAMHALLDADPDLTAVYVHSDVMAVGVLKALSERGLRVPDGFSIVGCDDMPFAAHVVPALTTVRVPFDETGELATSLLLDRIRGKDIPAKQLLPVDLIVRDSTGPPPDRRTRRAGRTGRTRRRRSPHGRTHAADARTRPGG